MRLAPIACTLLLVLAGCGGVMNATPTDDGSGSVSTTSESHVQTAVSAYGDADLPVEPTPVFTRVLNLTDRRVDSPVIEVESLNGSAIVDRERSAFRTALGITPAAADDGSGPRVAGYLSDDEAVVYVAEWLTENATETELTLAHEFVHVVQFREGWADEVWNTQRLGPGALSYDSRLTYFMVVEGAATYVERHYIEQRFPNVSDPEALARPGYENASAASRLSLARYTLGAEYVDDVVDSPADIASVHLSPPTSTEQVLHRNDDPVADLRVAAGEVGEWRPEERERQGELFLRIALRTELNRSTAVDAAAGWGNDRRITYERGNGSATAWVLRWDDADEATEFEDAFERYLGEKATKEGSVWIAPDGSTSYRVQRVGEETVAVSLGGESFVRAANVTVDDGGVSVGAN